MGKTRRKEKTFNEADWADTTTDVVSPKKKGKHRKSNNLPPEYYKDSFEEDEYYPSFQKIGKRR
jgi:hypothetical protein|tara:strand:- start:1136 stop:1327 length:192 start_codon:yes stop_codon:yes gene_type:complete